MKKIAILLFAIATGLPGCAVYEQPVRESRARLADRDRDGIPDRFDRDRDGDGVRNRQDRRPDNPRRY